jgi:hypothetical protein
MTIVTPYRGPLRQLPAGASSLHRCRQSRPAEAAAGAGGGQPPRLQRLWRQEQQHLSSDLGQAGCQSVRGDRPISGLQQMLTTIFSAVMSINDRPPCIRYTGAALLGAGRRPWEISHLPGHFKTGRLSRCYTAAPPTTRTDRGALVHFPAAPRSTGGVAPDWRSGHAAQKWTAARRNHREHVSSRLADLG